MKIKLKLKVYGAYCGCEVFEINNKEASEQDFGHQEDIKPDEADLWCCGDMKFIRKPATTEILEKYNITLEEYNEICDKLEEKLSFGKCGWCL